MVNELRKGVVYSFDTKDYLIIGSTCVNDTLFYQCIEVNEYALNTMSKPFFSEDSALAKVRINYLLEDKTQSLISQLSERQANWTSETHPLHRTKTLQDIVWFKEQFEITKKLVYFELLKDLCSNPLEHDGVITEFKNLMKSFSELDAFIQNLNLGSTVPKLYSSIINLDSYIEPIEFVGSVYTNKCEVIDVIKANYPINSEREAIFAIFYVSISGQPDLAQYFLCCKSNNNLIYIPFKACKPRFETRFISNPKLGQLSRSAPYEWVSKENELQNWLTCMANSLAVKFPGLEELRGEEVELSDFVNSQLFASNPEKIEFIAFDLRSRLETSEARFNGTYKDHIRIVLEGFLSGELIQKDFFLMYENGEVTVPYTRKGSNRTNEITLFLEDYDLDELLVPIDMKYYVDSTYKDLLHKAAKFSSSKDSNFSVPVYPSEYRLAYEYCFNNTSSLDNIRQVLTKHLLEKGDKTQDDISELVDKTVNLLRVRFKQTPLVLPKRYKQSNLWLTILETLSMVDGVYEVPNHVAKQIEAFKAENVNYNLEAILTSDDGYKVIWDIPDDQKDNRLEPHAWLLQMTVKNEAHHPVLEEISTAIDIEESEIVYINSNAKSLGLIPKSVFASSTEKKDALDKVLTGSELESVLNYYLHPSQESINSMTSKLEDFAGLALYGTEQSTISVFLPYGMVIDNGMLLYIGMYAKQFANLIYQYNSDFNIEEDRLVHVLDDLYGHTYVQASSDAEILEIHKSCLKNEAVWQDDTVMLASEFFDALPNEKSHFVCLVKLSNPVNKVAPNFLEAIEINGVYLSPDFEKLKLLMKPIN